MVGSRAARLFRGLRLPRGGLGNEEGSSKELYSGQSGTYRDTRLSVFTFHGAFCPWPVYAKEFGGTMIMICTASPPRIQPASMWDMAAGVSPSREKKGEREIIIRRARGTDPWTQGPDHDAV